jgi:hypothetical protein
MNPHVQMQEELAALGITSAMLGPSEDLALPGAGPQQALQAAPRVVSTSLTAYSPTLDTLGLRLELDPGARTLSVISRHGATFQLRPGLADAPPRAADEAGMARVELVRQGRFLIQGLDGTPLVLGYTQHPYLRLHPIYAWPVPPLEEWIVSSTDKWMLGEVHDGLGADVWRRTSLAGQLARLSESDALDVAALIAAGRLQDLISEVELAPRRWARSLDAASKAALEQQAVRRAEALGDDLEDLFDTLSADMSEASGAWRRLCHRRDDIESVRVLLCEADAGVELEKVLEEADRTGRAVRINLDRTVSAADERLRRVALGDPSAWWGSTDLEAHYF